jgi:plasmid stabilization system protein ParE
LITILSAQSKAANRFLECLEAATNWLSEHPTAGKPLSSRTRRYLMKTFPYLVVYQLKKDTLRIIGIVHEKRDPVNWHHLLSSKNKIPFTLFQGLP